MDHILDLPDLTFRTPSIRRRIHDNSIVCIPPAYLPFYKLYTVIYQPADRGVFQSGRHGILFGPCYHSFRSIHMCDLCSGSRRGQCSSAGVCKEVQDFDRTSGMPDLFGEPVPVCRLLGKQPRVFETERFQIKSQRTVVDLPLFRQTEKFPLTSAFFAAVIMSVHMFPSPVIFRSIPDNLGIRAYKDVLSPALQLFSFRAVYNFIILPVISNPHIMIPFIAFPAYGHGRCFCILCYSICIL